MGINAWTDKENATIVALYFAMLDSAIAGEAYSKAAMIRAVQRVKDGHDCDAARVTCGECAAQWCETCDPAPSALCHVCHGRGHLLAPLQMRSKGSIEAKLMNCTAAHELLDPTAVSMNGYGYRPLTRFQSSLRDAMARAMQQRNDMTEGAQRRQALAVSKRA